MRILHIIFAFPPDGAECMLVDIINRQSNAARVKFIVVNDRYNNELLDEINTRVEVKCLNRRPGSFNPLKIFQLNAIVWAFKPNVIHFHDHNGIRLLIIKNAFCSFLTIHGLHRPLTHLKKYSQLISISSAVQNDILRRGSLQSRLVFNGVDFEKIRKKSGDYINATFKIVQVGRLFHEIKGQDVLINSLYLLMEKRFANISIDFIGEGPSLHFLRSLAGELGIQDRVNFLGLKSRSFIYSSLCNYDLLVQPSLHEGFGLTVVEAMAAKIPVLVSDIDGPVEIIKNNLYGYKFEAGNAMSCAQCIEEIVATKSNPHAVERIERAYDYAKKHFSVSVTSDGYMAEYFKILEHR